jgi:hypothetical protein
MTILIATGYGQAAVQVGEYQKLSKHSKLISFTTETALLAA